ncbi:hypothetical protein BC827DRAFT_1269326 [Russula dissimulans]|nr:hypothetical protein BC827DRAFT_1269326 [Russula dissimulans]
MIDASGSLTVTFADERENAGRKRADGNYGWFRTVVGVRTLLQDGRTRSLRPTDQMVTGYLSSQDVARLLDKQYHNISSPDRLDFFNFNIHPGAQMSSPPTPTGGGGGGGGGGQAQSMVVVNLGDYLKDSQPTQNRKERKPKEDMYAVEREEVEEEREEMEEEREEMGVEREEMEMEEIEEERDEVEEEREEVEEAENEEEENEEEDEDENEEENEEDENEEDENEDENEEEVEE